MAHIIAGYLQQQDQVRDAINQLVASGFAKKEISAFYVNPAGQHDLYPIGGDQDKSPGAKESVKGLTTGITVGGAIGAALGATTLPLSGPLGAVAGTLVGAHVGSFVGSLSSMKESGEDEENDDSNTKPQRKSGMIVAVCVPDSEREDDAIQILQAQGAHQIERAKGNISDGDWVDFNPLTPPVLIIRKVQFDKGARP